MTAEECFFYHSIDLPEGTAVGCWDLRGATSPYLGNLDLRGKRVLEIGAANGYLSFWMERHGAQVVPFDLSPELLGDILPIPTIDRVAFEANYRNSVRGLNAAWWYAHDRLGSRLELRHATAYALPESVGEVDVATFGSILLHLRDPFSALAQAAPRVRDAIVVTDTLNAPFTLEDDLGLMRFNPSSNARPCTWWFLSPGGVKQMLRALGFTRFSVSGHTQFHHPEHVPWGFQTALRGPRAEGALFTVVARR